MTIILPLAVGFGLKAFEESFVAGRPLMFGDFIVTYMIYYIMIIAGMSLIIFSIGNMLIHKKGEHPSTQKNPSWFTLFSVSFIFNPEQNGLLYKLSEYIGFKGESNFMRWSLSIFRVLVVGTIIFVGVGLIQTITHTAFVGIPQMPFQMTETASVIFSAEPPAFAETTMFLVLFCFLMGINAYLCSKFRLGLVGFFIIGLIIVSPLIGISWMAFHNIVYGNSDASLLATFMFGFLGSVLTLLTGTFLFFYLWHFWNNVFVKLSELATVREDLILFTIIALVVLIVVWIAGEIIRARRKNKVEVYVPE